MDVHLRDLRYFLTVGEELHFSRAAERLFISQPALSKQIRQLERSLRVDLFDRAPRDVTLTAAGDALLPRARKLVHAWDDARIAVEHAAASESAALAVGLMTSVGRGILSGDVAPIRRPAPRLPTEHAPVRLARSHRRARQRRDRRGVRVAAAPGYGQLRVGAAPQRAAVVALPAGHELADHAEVTLDELLEEPFLALPKSAPPLRDFWLALDERAGRAARVVGEVASADATFEAVAGGAGIALVAAGNAELYNHGGVVARPVVGLGPSTLAVAWRADDSRELAADFVTACRMAAKAG